MNFGTEFTELAAATGSNKKDTNGDNNKFLLTGKQWILVIIIALGIAGGIDIWLRASGL